MKSGIKRLSRRGWGGRNDILKITQDIEEEKFSELEGIFKEIIQNVSQKFKNMKEKFRQKEK